MTSESTIEVTCPVCKTKWSVDLALLKKPGQVIYLIAQRRRRETYRVKCPTDGTYVIVDVEVEED